MIDKYYQYMIPFLLILNIYRQYQFLQELDLILIKRKHETYFLLLVNIFEVALCLAIPSLLDLIEDNPSIIYGSTKI